LKHEAKICYKASMRDRVDMNLLVQPYGFHWKSIERYSLKIIS